ncbi:ABC transporter ATP-binding protein [Paracoccaceae bacterium Fryx2]|nr:ABC transporter ATP-binding protein [Paracoccaceae bacterium Fryx2]
MDGVTKRFRHPGGMTSMALDGVSLEVGEQTFVALLGPSGCGKTTVLRLANGLITPDSGSVLLAGKPPQPGPGAGFVFQSFRLLPWATVRANVEFALEPLGLDRAERRARADRYLALVGLAGSADRHPGQLSGGMRQRVALARALAVEPDILLMDEPFASLDAQTRELLQIELMAIWARHRALVLFVTHSVDEAILLADRIVLMGSGRVLEQIEVGIERPRWSAEVRADRRFLDLRAYLWNRIRDLVLSDPASEFYGRATILQQRGNEWV